MESEAIRNQSDVWHARAEDTKSKADTTVAMVGGLPPKVKNSFNFNLLKVTKQSEEVSA
jgi:hypothetical protein